MPSNCQPPSCSGDLRTPFAIQRRTLADDGMGGQTPTWSQIGTGWGACASQSGQEGLDRGSLGTDRGVVMWARYGLGVTEKDRIVMEGNTYNVRKVEDFGMLHRWLRITMEAGVPVN